MEFTTIGSTDVNVGFVFDCPVEVRMLEPGKYEIWVDYGSTTVLTACVVDGVLFPLSGVTLYFRGIPVESLDLKGKDTILRQYDPYTLVAFQGLIPQILKDELTWVEICERAAEEIVVQRTLGVYVSGKSAYGPVSQALAKALQKAWKSHK